ncbi:hypothetical protein ABZ508_29595 [Streptomyces lavendulocolor]|uniref:Uracil-DNA glycosylase n=1 Tax=Streptomyces lavendulocolor TaxID=67316 RepID=A0ABV2WDW5_9ACTN
MTGRDGAAAPEDAYTAEPFVPRGAGLDALRGVAAGCRGCPLHRDATRTVFGAGNATGGSCSWASSPATVALGATAGKALLGPSFRVTEQRGVLLPLPGHEERGACLVATVHPSAVLRAGDRDAVHGGMVSDLRMAARALRRAPYRRTHAVDLRTGSADRPRPP